MAAKQSFPDGYTPHGAALELFHNRSPELVLSGPAGTGKSVACLTKLHICAKVKPGFRGLILRQTRESLTESALVTFERFVLPKDDPIAQNTQRRVRQSYRYPNGSEIIVGGLDKPSKVMSTEFDMVYIMEAIEVTENAWETVTTRLRGGTLAYQQMIADTNPDRPTHWLKLRAESRKTAMLESRHEDNPLLWDGSDWTEFGRTYLAKLDALTGPRLQRLRYGKWVQAEGVVYDGWDAAVHLVDRFPIPQSWRRYIAVDFGFTHPFVALWFAQDDDGRLYLYREIYRTRRLVEDHARDMLGFMHGEPLPQAIVCDHDADQRSCECRQ